VKGFDDARRAIGGLKGVMRALNDAPPFDHKWKSMESCPFCGKDGKGKAGVFTKGGTDLFKCHNPGCNSGGAVMTEVSYIAARLGLSDTKPATGGPSEAYRKFLELAGCWEEPPARKKPETAVRETDHDKAVDEKADAYAASEDFAGATPAAEVAENLGADGGAPSDGTADVPQSQQSVPPEAEPAPAPPPVAPVAGENSVAAALDKAGVKITEEEELIQNCIEVIRAENQASIVLLQRRLRLGYARAAAIMDELESRGIVGPSLGKKPREILAKAAPAPASDEKVIPFPGEKKEAPAEKAEKLPPGLQVLRRFFAQLTPTQMEMRPYLENGDPVPNPLTKDVASRLVFKPVPIFERRGLETATCRALGLRANPVENKAILQALVDEFGWDEMFTAGLALPADRRRKLPERLNSQFHGKGQVGKKPESDRRDNDDKWIWGWCQPVLIPFFDAAGKLVRLRPHKGGAPEGTIGGTRLYVPRVEGKASEERFHTVVICEGEFKAMALWQMVGGGSHLPAEKRIGVCAIPGISYGKNVAMREELQAWLWSTYCQRVIVAFDDEDKSHEPRWKRFDALKWARYLATSLHLKMGKTAMVCVLPKEWRDGKGKADWDGALVQLLKGQS
jgi:hypothetical protein